MIVHARRWQIDHNHPGFLACGAAVFTIGILLFSATTDVPKGHDSDVDDSDSADDIKHPPPVR